MKGGIVVLASIALAVLAVGEAEAGRRGNHARASRAANNVPSAKLQNKARRSVLENAKHKPSDALQRRIREHEGSGSMTGILLLAFLLGSNDLSAADRRWIEEQLAQSEGDKIAQEENSSPRHFEIGELDEEYQVGRPIQIEIRHLGNIVPTCVLAGAHARVTEDRTILTWTPSKRTARVLTCKAMGDERKRLIRVAEAVEAQR